MTTNTYALAGIRTINDAAFRTVGSAISGGLAAIGLVQTADTGQINWTTVTFPNLNTWGGYEIWRFNDALQSTAPIYFKLWYGTGNSGGTNGVANNLQLGFEIGTGTNGAGTLTGAGSANGRTNLGGTYSGSSVASVTSYLCMSGGNMSAAIACLAGTSFFFSIMRTQDSTGADTAAGACVVTSAGGINVNPFVWTLNFTTASYTVVQSQNMCRFGNVASSVVGGDNQAYLLWIALQPAHPQIGLCGVIAGEAAGGTTFTTTLFGSTSHTYMSHAGRSMPLFATGSGLVPAVLWE